MTTRVDKPMGATGASPATCLETAQLRALFDLGLEGIGLVIASPAGHVLEANDTYLDILGATREELRAGEVDWLRRTPPEWLPGDQAALVELRERGSTALGEKEYERRDRTRVPVLITGAALPDGNVLTVVIDITARKRLEVALRESEAAMAEARAAAEAANAAKSRFLASMSHELRTPMNAVLGMTELALQEPLSPRVRDMLGTAKDSADALLALLNDILDFSRIEAGRVQLERVPFGLREHVDKAIRPLRLRALQKQIELSIGVAAEVPDRLVGDPMRLRQVLTNLVGNAIKFTDAGRIDLRAGVVERTGHQVVLELTVTDTGIGIPQEDQERIFDTFTQVDVSVARQYGGSGLGLAISRRFVALMGGDLRVESRPGQGSTFRLTARFGVAEECEARAEAEPARPAALLAAPTRVLRLLLAEDAPASQKLGRYVLGSRGHDVVVAENGSEAVELVRSSRFDVVLMDVQMPVMDGFEATAAIRALDDPARARVPIVAMTAHALRGDAERCLAAGMNAYISKPIDWSELIRIVERLGSPRPEAG